MKTFVLSFVAAFFLMFGFTQEAKAQTYDYTTEMGYLSDASNYAETAVEDYDNSNGIYYALGSNVSVGGTNQGKSAYSYVASVIKARYDANLIDASTQAWANSFNGTILSGDYSNGGWWMDDNGGADDCSKLEKTYMNAYLIGAGTYLSNASKKGYNADQTDLAAADAAINNANSCADTIYEYDGYANSYFASAKSNWNYILWYIGSSSVID